jgi:hypothetical protein
VVLSEAAVRNEHEWKMTVHRLAVTVMMFAVILVGATVCSTAGDDTPRPTALEQCGDCHMVFPAQMLPGRSWVAILSKMDNHFGEEASIPEKDLNEILKYLTSNAADSPNTSAQDRHFMSGILPSSTPIRITQTPWWNQMHADFNFDGVRRSHVKSPANCLACHKRGIR